MPAYASQDSAVPVAFLITEIVELALENQPATPIAISLTPIEGVSGKASLSIVSPALGGASRREGPSVERFQRIVNGLARQLRSPLGHDVAKGSYGVSINILTTFEAD